MLLLKIQLDIPVTTPDYYHQLELNIPFQAETKRRHSELCCYTTRNGTRTTTTTAAAPSIKQF